MEILWICLLLAWPVATAQNNVSRIDVMLYSILGEPMAPLTPADLISNSCRADSQFYLEELKHFKQWALNMYDASAKLQAGILAGNIFNFGSFEQCLLVRPDSDTDFIGQHCMVDVQLSINENCKWCSLVDDKKKFLMDILGVDTYMLLFSTALVWGFCVPSSCSADDVYVAMKEKIKPLNSLGIVNFSIKAGDQKCYNLWQPNNEFTAIDYGFVAFMVFLCILLTCGSLYDIYTRIAKNESRQASFMASALKGFSLVKNTEEILNSRTGKGHIGCLNGIRLITAVWVFMGHKLLASMLTTTANWIEFVNGRYEWIRMFLHNAFVSTDTFLLVGGFVLTYTFLRFIQRVKRFNIPLFYLERYVRLTPIYAVIIFFHVSLMYHMGSGPRWNLIMGTERANCLNNWWSNMLYVNNYVGQSKNLCVETSWYLAVDMQLYLASPLLLWPLWRSPRRGLALLGVLMVAALIIPATITAVYRQPGLPSLELMKGTDFIRKTGRYYDHFNLIYTQTYARMGPYLLGIGLGYYMHMIRDKEIILSKWAVTFGWAGSIVLMLTIIFGSRSMYLDLRPYDIVEATIYAGLHRTVWALAVAWVIFACAKGYGGVVNAVLSSRIMAILNQFSFSIYICHWSYLLMVFSTERVPVYYSDFNNLRQFCGDIVLVICVAIVLTLTVDMPIRNLFRTLLRKGMPPPGKKHQAKADASSNVPQATGNCIDVNQTGHGAEMEMSTVVHKNNADTVEPSPGQNHTMNSVRE